VKNIFVRKKIAVGFAWAEKIDIFTGNLKSQYSNCRGLGLIRRYVVSLETHPSC